MDPDAQPDSDHGRVYGPRDPKQLTEIADKQIKQVLETVEDVGSISLSGERKREIQLLLNADRLNAYGLTVDSGPDRGPAAERRSARRQLRRGTRPKWRSARWAAFATSRTSTASSSPIAPTAPSSRSATSAACRTPCRRYAAPAGSSGNAGRHRSAVRKQSGTNTVAVVDRVMERLEQIQRTLAAATSRSASDSDQSTLHPAVVRGHQAAPVPRRPARTLRRVPVHPKPARHVHRRAGHSDVDHRHLHVHEGVRLHAEQHDDAGALARDRHRHRRCDRRAREHLPVSSKRRGSDAQGSRRCGHGRNRIGRHGDDAVAGGHLPAGGLHDRPGGPLLLQLRRDGRLGHPALDVRLLHPDAGALRLVDEEGRHRARSFDDEVAGCLRQDRPPVWPDARVVARTPARHARRSPGP